MSISDEDDALSKFNSFYFLIQITSSRKYFQLDLIVDKNYFNAI